MIPEDRLSRPASGSVTGWLCVVLGGILVLSGVFLALAALARRSFLSQGLDPFAQIEGSLDPLSRFVLRNLETFSLSQAAVGTATLAIGIGFLALRRWARPALETLAWITLAGSVLSGIWGIVAWLGPGGITSLSSLEGVVTPVAGMVLTLAQCVACVLVIRYLRSPEIRSLFRRGGTPREEERGAARR